jgi:hypothetical protein
MCKEQQCCIFLCFMHHNMYHILVNDMHVITRHKDIFVRKFYKKL